MTAEVAVAAMLTVALEEARQGLAEGGIPIGAALFGPDGELLGRGHNCRYSSMIMVTALSPCWYCSGLVRQFGIGQMVIGESVTFHGGHDWLAEHGVKVTVLADAACIALMRDFIACRPELWHEDIGE